MHLRVLEIWMVIYGCTTIYICNLENDFISVGKL